MRLATNKLPFLLPRSALKFSFHASNDDSLPVQLINSIIMLLSSLFKLAQNADAISQSTLEYVLRESVQVLLDPRLSGPKYEMAIMRPTNKVRWPNSAHYISQMF